MRVNSQHLSLGAINRTLRQGYISHAGPSTLSCLQGIRHVRLASTSTAASSSSSAAQGVSRSRWDPTTSRRTLGVVAAILAGGLIWMDMKNRPLIRSDAAAVPEEALGDSSKAIRLDPDTQISFPQHLPLTTQSPIVTLVGLGVRKVSFLRVKVYSAGFYLEESVTKKLDSVSGWHTFSAQHLLTPPTTSSDSPQLHGEALIQALLGQPIACAIRIVPVRNTDFSHLRDGFTRAIQARQKRARQAGTITPEEEERLNESVQKLKGLFPAQSVPKGKSLTMLRTDTGALVVEYEGKVLGSVQDDWMSRELMTAYFADKDVISEKLKEDVAHGLERFIKH